MYCSQPSASSNTLTKQKSPTLNCKDLFNYHLYCVAYCTLSEIGMIYDHPAAQFLCFPHYNSFILSLISLTGSTVKGWQKTDGLFYLSHTHTYWTHRSAYCWLLKGLIMIGATQLNGNSKFYLSTRVQAVGNNLLLDLADPAHLGQDIKLWLLISLTSVMNCLHIFSSYLHYICHF